MLTFFIVNQRPRRFLHTHTPAGTNAQTHTHTHTYSPSLNLSLQALEFLNLEIYKLIFICKAVRLIRYLKNIVHDESLSLMTQVFVV